MSRPAFKNAVSEGGVKTVAPQKIFLCFAHTQVPHFVPWVVLASNNHEVGSLFSFQGWRLYRVRRLVDRTCACLDSASWDGDSNPSNLALFVSLKELRACMSCCEALLIHYFA